MRFDFSHLILFHALVQVLKSYRNIYLNWFPKDFYGELSELLVSVTLIVTSFDAFSLVLQSYMSACFNYLYHYLRSIFRHVQFVEVCTFQNMARVQSMCNVVAT